LFSGERLACGHVGDIICPSEAAVLVAGTADCKPLVERSIRAARPGVDWPLRGPALTAGFRLRLAASGFVLRTTP